MHPLYSAAKLGIGLLAAVASGSSYLATETVANEATLIPLGVAVMVAVFIGHLAFKWGARIARLEDRIAALEGTRDSDRRKQSCK